MLQPSPPSGTPRASDTPPRCDVCRRAQPGYSWRTCSEECFIIKFWMEKVVWRLRGDMVTVEDSITTSWPIRTVHPTGRIAHFTCVPDTIFGGLTNWLGHGGHMFYFRMTSGPHEGAVIKSNSVWSQASVPIEFELLLPPNAVEITKEQYDAATADTRLEG